MKQIVMIVILLSSITATANKILVLDNSKLIAFQTKDTTVWVSDTKIEQELTYTKDNAQVFINEFIKIEDIKSLRLVTYDAKYDSGIIEIEFLNKAYQNYKIAFPVYLLQEAIALQELVLEKLRK